MKKVAVVILNYNGWEDTLECIESFLEQDHKDYQLIIVDNNSENDSYSKILSWLKGEEIVYSDYLNKKYNQEKRSFLEISPNEAVDPNIKSEANSDDIILIRSTENLGFSGGNNIGAKYAANNGYDYTLLLNNDTIIIDKDFLIKLISPFQISENVYLTGPNTINFNGTFDSPMIEDTFMGNLFYLPLLNFFRKKLNSPAIYFDLKAISSPNPTAVYKVSGACMMFKTELLKELNYLDENVWLSSEEAILSEKIRGRNGLIYFQPLTTLIHKKGKSPRPKSDSYSIIKNHYKQRSYFYKNYRKYGKFKLGLLNLTTFLRLIILKIF
jgi:GT2 family glycosyltransferase